MAYVTRDQPGYHRAEGQLGYLTRADREDLVYTRTRNLPAWAAGSPSTYFQAAERHERANGNSFEEWKITVPVELSQTENMDLMRDLVDTIAGDTLPITYALHCPDTLDHAHEQPHLHLLLSARQHDGIARTASTHFKQYQPKHPERGGARKDPTINHWHAVKAWRVTICDLVNLHLERAGHAARVHPDRLEDRGIARKPEPKLRPSESRAYRERGAVVGTMVQVVEVRATRHETVAQEQANAQAYWVARKVVLGLTEGMDRAEQLAVIAAARGQVRDQKPARTVDETQVVVETARQRDPVRTARGWRDVGQELAGLAAALDALSEEGQGQGVRVKLWEQGGGLGF